MRLKLIVGLLMGVLITIYISACTDNVSSGIEESLELYAGLDYIEGTENSVVRVNKGSNAQADGYFQVEIGNLDPNLLIPKGVTEAWCLEWKKPLRSDNDLHNGVRLYSTVNNKKWLPMTYFFSIKDELRSVDSELTYREFQAVIWSLTGYMGVAPEFDVRNLSDSQLPSRLLHNGTANFSRDKVVTISNRVLNEYESISEEDVARFSGIVAQTSEDEQDIIIPPDLDPDINPGIVTGTIVDAITDNPLVGASIAINNETGTISDDMGQFSLSLDPDFYTAIISFEGYSSTVIENIEVTEDQTTSLGVIALSPILLEGEFRIVLTWGETPSDLDAHLTGPIPSETNRFHVWWSNRGSLISSPFAQLDRDDLDSFGPETITISQFFDGIYRYSVHDFTNRLSQTSNQLALSNAIVRLFNESGQIGEYQVPNEPGTLWTVFEIDGSSGSISPINTMSFNTSQGSTVAKVNNNDRTDGNLIHQKVMNTPKVEI